MKKNVLTGYMAAGMMALMLTGCGEKPAEAVTEAETKVETEADTVTEPETEPETEAVLEDVISKYNYTIESARDLEISFGVSEDSDEMKSFPVHVDFTETSTEDGYVDTVITYSWKAGTNRSLWIAGVYDKYSGKELIADEDQEDSIKLDAERSSHVGDVVIVEVDGTEYDCSVSGEVYGLEDGETMVFQMTVHHPEDYDGLLFAFGGYNKSVLEEMNQVESEFIYDYPEKVKTVKLFTPSGFAESAKQ